MEIEILLAVVILIAMIFLATVDSAFSHLSDVGLRRLASDSEDSQNAKTATFLREILEYRPRFLSVPHQRFEIDALRVMYGALILDNSG